MSDTTAGLRRQIAGAGDLQAVVRTMKAVAASRITQYENSVRALTGYRRVVESGLGACLREVGRAEPDAAPQAPKTDVTGAVVFGSDQGLVGQFNQVLAAFAIKALEALPGTAEVWAVGERVHARLADAGVKLKGLLAVPASVEGIAPLVERLQLESEGQTAKGGYTRFYLFHNRPQNGALYAPVGQRLLPVDEQWREDLVKIAWPTRLPPQVWGGAGSTLRALLREYLFISIFQACAESLSSENASRLAAMQRADRNIDELLEDLHGRFLRLRQGSIDEELFDVVAGYEALGPHGGSA